MKKFLLFIFLITIANSILAQNWVDVWHDQNASFTEKQQAFKSFFEGKDMTQIKGWKAFKRWEYLYQRRMQTGETEEQLRQRTVNYFLQQLQNNSTMHTTQSTSQNGTWSFIGPSQTPTSGGGAGRATCMVLDNSNNVLIGAPAGGLWRRNGTNWSTNTDQLSYLGISDILINPTNNNAMYAATGDADAGDAICIGVIKSVDGGVNWTSAGLTNASRIYKIMHAPTDFNKIIAATNLGVFYTTNGGTTWTQSTTGGTTLTAHDIEFKPTNANTIYMVSANNFWTSTDGGISFANTGTAAGLPTTGNNRRAIAVTGANDNYIYMLASRSDNSGFHSLWRSTDAGGTFTKMKDGLAVGAPNLLGWSNTGNDAASGGQGWYDLSIAVHPANADIVYTGGVNIWMSVDGGTNFAINGHWTGSGAPYVHADIHALEFDAAGNLYACSDGGIFYNTSTFGSPNWTDLSNGLQIAQMYRLGVSQTNDGLVITGWQDNGTNLRNSSVSNWRRVIGGDGFESAIDPTNASIMFGELYYGAIYKSTNGGTGFSTIVNSGGTAGTISADGPWLTNYVIAPSNPNIMYVGKSNVFRNTNGGTGGAASWTAAVGIPSGAIYALAVAPTNENTVYTAIGGNMYVTTDGTNYTLRNAGLPGGTITYIAISNTPAEAYCTVNSGTGNTVFKTINAGVSWTNITGNLPNISPQCIALDVNSPTKQLYVGHLNGIYTKNDTMVAWVLFDNALPNTEVTELEIVYSSSKIKAATYGRGAWESDLFSPVVAGPCLTVPTANFTSNTVSVCPTETVTFSNTTASCATATYSWSFPGGTPATSTAQNPTVTYNTSGAYAVTLIATNTNGSNTKTTTNYLTVKPTSLQGGSISADKTTICSYENVNFSFTGSNNGTGPIISWFKNNVLQGTGSGITLNALATGDVIKATVAAGTSVTCISNATFTTNTVTMTVIPQPAKPSISQVVGDLLSSSATGNQWFGLNGLLTGVTTTAIHPTVNGIYSVQVTQNGCVSPMSDPFTVKIEDVNILYPVPSKGNMTFDFYVPVGVTSYTASVYSSIGQLVIKGKSTTVTAGLNRENLKFNGLAAGVYNMKVQVGDKTYTKRVVITQ
jgi:PKD repeat protein